MTLSTKRTMIRTIAALVLAAGIEAAPASGWTEPVELLHEHRPFISYRAQLDGEFLVVEAKIEPGWHTFVMDNKQRSTEKLAGKQSLGVDGPTEIAVTGGLEVTGQWHQSPPKDFSKPEMRWYSWGYEEQARFVAKARRASAGAAQIQIRGQACTDTTCKNIDVTIALPVAEAAGASSKIDLKALVPVRASE